MGRRRRTLFTNQYQRRVVETVSAVNVDAFLDLFLADFEVAPSTSLAEDAECVAQIKWIVLLENSGFDLLVLIMKGGLEVVLFQDTHGLEYRCGEMAK